jgi:ABC-type transport system involved in cytochrome c biogenesis permease subunit
MPELEQLIAQWRRGLLETTGCSAEVLDELESHLRDEIQQLVATGHTPEQALTLAAARLGNPSTLAAEFAKIAKPGWLPARLVTIATIVLGVLLIGYLFPRWQDRWGVILTAHVCSVILGYTSLFLVGLLAVCYVARRPFRDLNNGQMKSLGRAVFTLTATSAVLTFIGILLGCIWANEHLGRYWGWDAREIGGGCVLSWDCAMLLLLWTRRAPEGLAIRLGILGNVVVGVAWFGTTPQLAAWLPVFKLTQLALFGVGFVPADRLRRREA